MTLVEPFGQFADAAPVPAPTWASDADEEFPEFSGTLAAQSDPGLYPAVSPVPESEHRAPALHVLHEDGTVELAGPYVDASSSYAEPETEPLEASGFEPTLSLAAQLQEEEAQQAELPSANFSEMVDRMQGFAPGHGLLEEETIDEDEYDFEPMHAHAHSDDGDQEDLEEETLDQRMEPSALSDAVRDSRLEQRVKQEQEQEQARDQEQTPEAASFVAQRSEAAFRYEEVGEEEFEEEGDEPAHEAEPGEPQRAGRSDESRNRGRGRSSGGRNGRRNGGAGHGRGRSAQSQDLPIISELLKQGQEILVQIAKEPIAKKGARITSHIALPGRFLVFMPTVHHVGVSRKIESDEERQRLKRILISEKGDASGGFIVRTAAEGASEEDLRADLRFLISLWTEVKQRSETAKAPALIYHDLNLIERILRDQVSSNFSTIWVDSEAEYERIIRFLSRFQPQLVRRVKLYTKETPLFEHFGIQEEISKALKSKVWLKSGGSIVINQTEALVAIDINTGKFVGKTSRLEDTIVKTNLDAIPEIVRQIRLRDLGGIIVIDFIDMDERKNRNRVLAALEEELKNDRAPSKVLQFNDFGLVAITRKRVKQSLERTLSVQCETCTGTGMVKSPITVCNEIYTEMRKMMKHLDGKDVMLRVNPEVVKQLKANNGRWINELEEMVTKTIIIKSDPALHPEQFDIH
jgi:ribonuclease G